MPRYQSEPVGFARMRISPAVAAVSGEQSLFDVGAMAVDDAFIIREMRAAIGAGEIRRAMAWMIYLRDQPANGSETHVATCRPSSSAD